MEEDGLAAEGDMAGAEQHQLTNAEHICHEKVHKGLPANLLVQGSSTQWQQAFDERYGCFYYYRESTQVTQADIMVP